MKTSTPPEAPLLYDVGESCAKLGNISRSQLYKLIDDEQLERVNIGRRCFVTGRSLNSYVESLSA